MIGCCSTAASGPVGGFVPDPARMPVIPPSDPAPLTRVPLELETLGGPETPEPVRWVPNMIVPPAPSSTVDCSGSASVYVASVAPSKVTRYDTGRVRPRNTAAVVRLRGVIRSGR